MKALLSLILLTLCVSENLATSKLSSAIDAALDGIHTVTKTSCARPLEYSVFHYLVAEQA